MKRKFNFLLVIFASLLIGCSHSPKQDDLDPKDNDPSGETIDYDEEDDSKIDRITLNKSTLDLVVGKYEYLYVNFYPDNEETADLHDGEWSTSDDSVVTVSQYGKVTAIKEGVGVVSFTTVEGNRKANCTVYVHSSESAIVREYQKVEDPDTIKNGDQIIFASPEFGVTATINRLNGYLKTSKATFSSDKKTLLTYEEDTGVYFVGASEGESFTLENQENNYLSGKTNDYKNSLVFVHSKGAINWIFEIPEGYSSIYTVNYDLVDDLWLMFNKINDNDIRFNLYDSNPGSLMALASIYRLTIIH